MRRLIILSTMVMVFWSGSFVQSSQAVETEEKMDIVEQLINCPDGGELHLKFIEQMKHDPDPWKRSCAAATLRIVKKNAPQTQEAFLWILDNDQEGDVLNEAILGIPKNPTLMKPLEKILKARLDKEIQIWEEIKNNTRTNHNDSDRRSDIAFILASIKGCGPESFEVLEKYEDHIVIKETPLLSLILLADMSVCGSEKSFNHLKSHLKNGDLTEMPSVLGCIKYFNEKDSDEAYQALVKCALSDDMNKRRDCIGSLEVFYNRGKVEALKYLERLSKDDYHISVVRESRTNPEKELRKETVIEYPVRDLALKSLKNIQQKQ